MEKWKIPLYKIYTDEEDIKIVTKILKRGRTWAIGPEIEKFENAIKDYVGSKYCITLNSGTSALHAILLASGIQKNDEVIVPSFSFISTANSVLFVGATPKFVDIEEEYFGLNPDLISKSITKKTKAIMPMDYAGQSCNIFEIRKIAQEHKIPLIEDAAEGLGSSIKGKQTGSVSDSAIFSFTGNKVITTGEGGAVVTNSQKIFEKLKLIRSHGRLDKMNYFENSSISNYTDIGYNWRMPTIIAALGITQLSKLKKIIKMRQNHAKFFSSKLSKHEEITVPSSKNDHDHIFQMYTIRLKNKKIRDSLQNFLTEKQIFSKIYFSPIHLTYFYRKKFGAKSGMLPITEKISNQVLTLPIYPNMTKEEKYYITDSIDEFFEKINKNNLV